MSSTLLRTRSIKTLRFLWSLCCFPRSERSSYPFFFFFFNDTATTEIYTLSLHDALPIYFGHNMAPEGQGGNAGFGRSLNLADRKSTRLNSSHVRISYAVFCLKKKNMLPGIVQDGTVAYVMT